MSNKFPISRRRFLQLIGGITAFIAILPEFRKSLASQISNAQSFFSRQSDEQETVRNVPGQAIIPFHNDKHVFDLEEKETLKEAFRNSTPTILKCHLMQLGISDPSDLQIEANDVTIFGSSALVLVTVREGGETLPDAEFIDILESLNSDISENRDPGDEDDEERIKRSVEGILAGCEELLMDPDIDPIDEVFPVGDVSVYPYLVNSLASGQPDAGPPDSGGGGGPACKPRRVNNAVSPVDWQFTLPSGILEPEAEEEPSECLVFILDTIPQALDDLIEQDRCLLERQVARHNACKGTSLKLDPAQYDAILYTLESCVPNTGPITPLLGSLLTGITATTAREYCTEGSDDSCAKMDSIGHYTEHVKIAQSNVLEIFYNPTLRLDCNTEECIPDYDLRIARKVRLGNGKPADHDYPYCAMDHGLFIAGIIHTITENDLLVKLNVCEALNTYGMGTTHSFSWGLECAYDQVRQLPRDGNQCVVVNASLYFEYPFSDLMLTSLQQTVDDFRKDVNNHTGRFPIIVAAAGNEGESGNHPPARLPADLNNVVGVASLEYEPNPTGSIPTALEEYSNRPPKDGFSVFGGRTAGGSDMAHPDNGILGAYIGAFPPQGATPPSMHKFDSTENNTTDPPAGWQRGWARWAGTSFSTAIITGVLARLATKGVTDPVNHLQGLTTHDPGNTEYPIVIQQP